MIKINYWTSQLFEENFWDKYYCKSTLTARRKLKVIEKFWNERGVKNNIKAILKEFDKWVFDKKTCFNVWDCNISIWDLHINIAEIILD